VVTGRDALLTVDDRRLLAVAARTLARRTRSEHDARTHSDTAAFLLLDDDLDGGWQDALKDFLSGGLPEADHAAATHERTGDDPDRDCAHGSRHGPHTFSAMIPLFGILGHSSRWHTTALRTIHDRTGQ